MQKIVLFGGGQTASHSYYHLTHESPYEVAAFTLDRAYIQEKELFGLPVVPFEEVECFYPPAEFGMLVSISYRGVNRLRAEKYRQAKEKGYRLVNSISPRTVTYPDLTIGDNCRVGANTIIDPFVRVGSDVTIASGCIVGHHTVVGDHVFVAAGAVVSGSVTIEPYCFIGANATIRDRVTVRAGSVIGAGAVILEDTQEGGVYLGRPAEQLPIHSDQLPLG